MLKPAKASTTNLNLPRQIFLISKEDTASSWEESTPNTSPKLLSLLNSPTSCTIP